MENKKGFNDLGVPMALCKTLQSLGISDPTHIQALAIPKIMDRKDIYGFAETGSGKTYAYLLPVFARLDKAIKGAQAVIITPTHELASQVARVASELADAAALTCNIALLIGGASISRQLEKLKEKPEIIIGSSGRVLELIEMRKLRMHNVKTVVIDEADRMLDKINNDALAAIIKCTLRERQLLFFSATCNSTSFDAASKLVLDKTLELVTPPDAHKVPTSIRHIYFAANQKRDKIILLRKLLAALDAKRSIIFLDDKNEIQEIASRLNYHNIPTAYIYGEDKKNNRRIALERIRNGSARVLVSTDLGARGLDINDVELVVSMNAPEDPERYLHRAGRTGRQGKGGVSALILNGSEQQRIGLYEKKLGVTIEQVELNGGTIRRISVI